MYLDAHSGRPAPHRRSRAPAPAARTCAFSPSIGLPTADHARPPRRRSTRLAFPYRWSTRAIMHRQDRRDQALPGPRSDANGSPSGRRSRRSSKKVMTNEASTLLDTDAPNKALDADAGAAGTRLRPRSAKPTAPPRLIVWGDDARLADEDDSPRRKDDPGPRLHLDARRPSTPIEAWLGSLAGPPLRQCPPAAGLCRSISPT